MMKKFLLSGFAFLVFTLPTMGWTPKTDKIMTPWGEKVTPENAWQTYPRPQLKRADWTNLNGLWQYAVTNKAAVKSGVSYNGEILVPFAIESALSGVAKSFTPEDKLWYKREFTLNRNDLKDKQFILHFGAVDHECQIWLNNKLVGSHVGGNNPFSFNITPYIDKKGKQVLELSVVDPTDTESNPRGKQQLNQHGIWYTPVSGIWQTVWLEAVNSAHINSLLPQSDIERKEVSLNFDFAGTKSGDQLKIKVKDGNNTLSEVTKPISSRIDIPVSNPSLWTPENPKLYGLEIELLRKGKALDKVESYFAMRKISKVTDEKGYQRIGLNGKPIFNYGTLDQGWWPDGLLTPPSEEAMLWDMVQLKEMGFNTIRKHIKVEPALYYYYADSLGIMLWQDMPSGFANPRKEIEFIEADAKEDWNAPAPVANQFKKELEEMIDNLRFFPSIVTWVVFNEGWGQHNTVELTKWTQQKDPTRLINGMSGWTERFVGDMYDIHNYPATSMILPKYCGGRISVLGEFGGLGLPVKGNLWNSNMRNWGYKNMDGSMDLVNDYNRLMYDLETLIAQGLSAAIYTQTTDVEGEVNGLITYDRKVVKMPATLLNVLHSRLYNITPVKADVLIADGQNGDKQTRDIVLNGKHLQSRTPLDVKGEASISSTHKFTVNKKYNNLSLWLNVNGPAKVKINGQTVFDQTVRLTRHYNQYNISHFAPYLKIGENIFEIETEQKESRFELGFDYGLMGY